MAARYNVRTLLRLCDKLDKPFPEALLKARNSYQHALGMFTVSESNQGHHSINHLMKQQRNCKQPTLIQCTLFMMIPVVPDSIPFLVKQHSMRSKGTVIALSHPLGWPTFLNYWLQIGVKTKG